jgi:hypothetical protein
MARYDAYGRVSSDKTSQGDQRGDIGINAHHQLIARIP